MYHNCDMKKILLPLLLLAAWTSKAQINNNIDLCKSVNEIARMERLGHQRLGNNTLETLAGVNIDVKYYRCEWEVDPAVYYISGKVTVYFVMNSASNSISFDLMNSMTVDSAKQHGTLLTKTHTSNVLQLTLTGSLAANTLDSVSIYYKGPPANTGFGSFEQTAHAGVPVIWTLSEPYGSRDWWPCKNGLDDKADSIDIIITNPVLYRAAANGIMQTETLVAGGTKRQTWWKHRYPIATYLMCFSVTNFSVFNNSVQLGAVNMPMQTHCYPENLLSFQNGTQNVLNALQLFHNVYGDYPFIKEKYGHVQFGWGGGMEHQTSTFVVSIDEGLIVHELAHQWFGDKITCGSWEDIWLNEGFATYLTDYYMETKYPANLIPIRRNEVNYITSSTGGSVWVDDTSSVGRIFDGRLSYNKGSHLLYMLRWKLGDSIFLKGMQQYQKDPKLAYGFAKTDDLKRNLEQVSGQNLTSFFTVWFKGQGYPSYHVEWSQLGSDYVNIKMNQTTSHPSVSFFDMPVALVFKNATQQKTIVVDNKTNGETFIKNIGFIADTVLIDPNYWLITKNNTTLKVASTSSIQNDIRIYPNPVHDQFTVFIRNFSAATASISLYNSVGQRISITNINLVNGTQYLQLPAQNLAAGSYQVVIRGSDGFKYVKKLLKL